jgi:hypothetical protein
MELYKPTRVVLNVSRLPSCYLSYMQGLPVEQRGSLAGVQ